MNKKNKSLIALLLVLCVGLVGLTIAYFSNSDTIENQFITKEYGTTYTEEFTSPDNWLPGDTTDKTIVATNTGQVDQAVRISLTEVWTPNKTGSTLNGWIHQDGTKSTHESESELENDEKVAIINFDNDSDWYYEDGYYYYKYKLAPNESTTSLIKSVTFNPNTKLDDTCVTIEGNGTKTITCNSSGSDYDDATYKLTFNIETVQYNKYAAAWQLPQNTTVVIGGSKPQGVNFAQHIMNNANAVTVTNYTDGVTTEAYTFEHEATDQTPALTDYRYIGASPNNYVEFNCDDNGQNCEIWRAIGVFYVDDGNNNWEWRVKLVRKSQFEDEMQWNSEWNNDWSQSSLNLFLNNAYYNSIQDAVEFGLKSTSRKMVENSKYYLGGFSYDIARNIWYSEIRFGNAKEIYSWERGNNLCGACGTDTTKLSWIGKIGLMYASDIYMVYDYGVNNQCYDDPLLCSDWGTIGWINIDDFIDSNGYTWLISPFSDNEYVSIINAGCNLFDTPDYNVRTPFSIHPTLYLSSSVKTTSGDGSIDSPYKLSL